MKPWIVFLLVLLSASATRAHAFGVGNCSYDQDRIFREETPYPLMVDLSNSATFTATLAAWATENTSGQHTPTWALMWLFASATGLTGGPDCSEIPGVYVDDVAIAEEKTALPPDRATHLRLISQFAQVHAVNVLILGAAMYDNNNPATLAAAGLAAVSPLIAYGLHEWWTISRQRQLKRSQEQAAFNFEPTFTARPEPFAPGHDLRFTLGLSMRFSTNVF